MTPLVEVYNLTLRRADRVVLHIPALTLQEGEVLTLVGANGAGKTTFLLALAGLVPPAQGELIFAGRRLDQWKALDYRRRVALVLQEALLLDRSVLENLLLGLRFRRVPRSQAIERVTRWAERLGIAHLMHRRAHSLSGGEAQRVSLARALVLEPQLLLLDEPFAALDLAMRAELLRNLHFLLRQKRITTVLVTHHLDEAALLGDRIAVFGQGTLQWVGPVAELRPGCDHPAAACFPSLSAAEAAYKAALLAQLSSAPSPTELDPAVYFRAESHLWSKV